MLTSNEQHWRAAEPLAIEVLGREPGLRISSRKSLRPPRCLLGPTRRSPSHGGLDIRMETIHEHPVGGGLREPPGGEVQPHGRRVGGVDEYEDLLEPQLSAVFEQRRDERLPDSASTKALLHINLVEEHLLPPGPQLAQLRPPEEPHRLAPLVGHE